jgi:hypothetical protein
MQYSPRIARQRQLTRYTTVCTDHKTAAFRYIANKILIEASDAIVATTVISIKPRRSFIKSIRMTDVSFPKKLK